MVEGEPVNRIEAPSSTQSEGSLPANAKDCQVDAAVQEKTSPPQATGDVAGLLEQAVQRIAALIQSRNATEMFLQDLITKLHDSLQEHSSRSAILPVITAILRLHEEMEKQAEKLNASGASLTPERMLVQFKEFAEDLGDVLEQAGVIRFVDEAHGDRFNPNRQQILGQDRTEDPEQNHRISARVRPGADFGKTLLRREAVRVYTYEVSSSNSKNSSDTDLATSGKH